MELPLSVAYDPFWNNEVEDYLSLTYMAFERTHEKEGLFVFYTLPEHADERTNALIHHISEKDVWIATGSEVVAWWESREGLELNFQQGVARVSNNGRKTVSNVVLKTNEGLVALPPIEPDETIEIRV